jgi:hypothetical protein
LGAVVPVGTVARGIEELTCIARRRRTDAGCWRDLSTIEIVAGKAHDAAVHLAKAVALDDSPGTTPGRVLAAAVYNLNGKPKGLVHELVAFRRTVDEGRGGGLADQGILGTVDPAFVEDVRRVLEATKGYARAHWPHLCRDANRYAYLLKVAKDDEPSSGTSAGLPVAMAFLSVLLSKPVPRDLAMSGAVTADAEHEIAIRPVGDTPHKVKGAYHANLRAILLPADNRPDVEREERVPITVSRGICRFVSRLDDAVEAVWGREAWDW